jgi:ubiquinone/menaquinone biosynthesis C-methylase UbiE
MAAPTHRPNPEAIFDAFNSYQKTMALKGAIELELFTHIDDGATAVAEIARRCAASERGIRILCDYMTIQGFLAKSGSTYSLTPDAKIFLSKRSPAYMGTAASFLTNLDHLAAYNDVAAIVRKGGTVRGSHMEPDHPIWVDFARSMVPIVMMGAQAMAEAVAEPGVPMKVLDLAAGHGMFGISVARRNPAAEIYAVDWKNVLQVALENANRLGVTERYHTIAGSAFEVDFGTGYDVVLIPNFLHHFGVEQNVKLIKKVRAALKPGGLVATLEFVPNDDRITPPVAAAFSLMMLGATEAGDAYTYREIAQMFRDAGFGESTIRQLDGSPEQLILTRA